MTRGSGPGWVHERIIRAVIGGAHSLDAIATAIKDKIAGDSLIHTLKRMEKSRWIVRNQRGVYATDAGRRAFLPREFGPPPRWMVSVYTPPAPAYRRPDSDPSIYPSVTAPGRLQDYQHHV